MSDDRLAEIKAEIEDGYADTIGVKDILWLVAQLEAARTENDDLLMDAWGLIANANEGDWDSATPEWKAAAERWRDAWHAHLAAVAAVRAPREPALSDEARRRIREGEVKPWKPTGDLIPIVPREPGEPT